MKITFLLICLISTVFTLSRMKRRELNKTIKKGCTINVISGIPEEVEGFPGHFWARSKTDNLGCKHIDQTASCVNKCVWAGEEHKCISRCRACAVIKASKDILRFENLEFNGQEITWGEGGKPNHVYIATEGYLGLIESLGSGNVCKDDTDAKW